MTERTYTITAEQLAAQLHAHDICIGLSDLETAELLLDAIADSGVSREVRKVGDGLLEVRETRRIQ